MKNNHESWMYNSLFESEIQKDYPKERNVLCFSISFSRFTFKLENQKFNKEESVSKITTGLQATGVTGS